MALHHYSSEVKHLDLESGDFIFMPVYTAERVVEGEAAARHLIFYAGKLERRNREVMSHQTGL